MLSFICGWIRKLRISKNLSLANKINNLINKNTLL